MGLLIAALICIFPAIVCAYILVFETTISLDEAAGVLTSAKS